ncbi:MAG: CaiB/BaiF CoA transferase family protein [Alphaproteobacteria bacterium]
MRREPASSALARFTVIDLTRARAGPVCARQLGDWGADVIKVELPPGGDAVAQDFASRHDPDFQNLHRNKRSITLNLKDPDGLEVLMKLAANSDVLVENYRPNVKERLGFGYEALKAVNPKIVLTSISGFGQTGPYADRPGLDQIAQGMGGMMSVTGLPGQGPVRAGIAVSDMAAGMLGAIGTLTALLEREVSGEGQWVQTSLLEAQLFMLDFQAARYLMRGEVPGQAGNDHPTAVPMGTYRTADGHINIAAMPMAWGKFCTVMGLDHLTDDPDFSSPTARLSRRAEVTRIVEDVTTTRNSDHWIGLLNDAGIPCGPIYGIDEAFADEQVQHLEIAEEVQSETLGQISLLGQAITMNRTPNQTTAATPELGADTDSVLESLGYSADQIADLRARNVL